MRRIVVLGGGFGGLAAARRLEDELSSRRGVEITVVSDRSHFLFTPLWAGVVGGTSQLAQIEIPLRSLLDRPVRFAMDRVTEVDLEHRTVVGERARYPFDFLVIAIGAETNWRGNAQWVADSMPCKSGRDAVDAFEAVGRAFVRATRLVDRADIRRALTFVVGGAGPSGVELMGHLVSRIQHDVLPGLETRLSVELRLLLVEPQGSLLPEFPAQMRPPVETYLREAGVDVRLHDAVVGRTSERVDLASGDSIACDNFFWCGGVRPPAWLARSGFETDTRGRILVHRDLQAVGHHAVYVVGDAAGAGDDVPMKADVAAEQGEVAAKNVVADLAGRSRRQWRYEPAPDALSMGRNEAVVLWGGVPVNGRGAHALRATTYAKLIPGSLRRLALMRDLFAGAVARRPLPSDRLLE